MIKSCLKMGLIGFALGLAGCDTAPPEDTSTATPVTAPTEPPTTYQAVSWSALPQTSEQELLAGFAAWRSGCVRLAKDPVWAESCANAAGVALELDAVNRFLQAHFSPYQLHSAKGAEGLITGYYEPIYPGSLTRTERAQVPVYGVPKDMIVVSLEALYPELKGKRLRGRLEGRRLVPYADNAQILAQGVNAEVLAWLESPMDLAFLQIQGSGRVQLENGRQLRLGYAEQNGHPYRPIGRWLVEQGHVPANEISMQRIRSFAEQHPEHLEPLLASNPSYVFFNQNPDSQEGPRGSLNVPLSAGFSVAIDRKMVRLGSLMWLKTTLPDGQTLQRPVAAQDTGGAIVGEVRADLFVGTGAEAGDLAGLMKQSGELWLLWPQAHTPPTP